MSTEKNPRERLKEIKEKGYDKTKFCSAECAVDYVCNSCQNYDFNGKKKDGRVVYTGDGKCSIHGPKEPGEGCDDFRCFRLKK